MRRQASHLPNTPKRGNQANAIKHASQLDKPPVQSPPTVRQPSISYPFDGLDLGVLDLASSAIAPTYAQGSSVQNQRSWWYWPEYLISLGAHLVLVIVLAWFTVQSRLHEAHSLSFSSADPDLRPDALMEMAPERIIQAENDLLDPLISPAEMTLTNLLPTTEFALQSTLPSIFSNANRIHIDLEGRITSGRTGDAKAELLRRYGGTLETEAAVQRGLRWLLKQQATDGSWSLRGPYQDGASFDENRNAATAMALLAFAGAGSTHLSGEYKETVAEGVKWLVAKQNSEGSFGENVPRHHLIYTHAQATLLLCELLAMTDDSWLVAYCEKAVRYLQRAQGTEGGWRYAFKGDSDTSVTGWCLMALVSGKSAGMSVQPEVLKGVSGWLGKVDCEYGTEYSYARNSRSTPAMTAEGLLCRMYLGWPRNHPSLDKSIAKLQKIAPFKGTANAYYYWYYATQVMHHVGGKAWQNWNAAMRVELPGTQVMVEPELGSWPPAVSGPDKSAGRLYSTCLAIYCLEVYYRHLPIYGEPSTGQ